MKLFPLSRVLSLRRRTGLMVVAAASLLSQPLQSAVYISNIENAHTGGQAVSSGIWTGFSFTTDSGDYTLDRVNALLSFFPGGAVEGRLYATGRNGIPTSWISEVAFTQTPLEGEGSQVFSFTPTTVMQLEANTTYAFVLAGLNGITTNWRLGPSGETSTEVPGSSWSLVPGLFMSFSEGSYWMSSETFILASVEASMIPEPGSLMVIGGGILAGAVALRRRRRR